MRPAMMKSCQRLVLSPLCHVSTQIGRLSSTEMQCASMNSDS